MTTAILTIPPTDSQKYRDLPTKGRAEVQAWLRIVNRILDAPSGKRGVTIQAIARELRVSATSVRRKLDAYLEDGWQGLINKAKYQPVARRVPPKFEDHIATLVERHQRDKVAAAWRLLIIQWEAGNETPGYPRPSNWPEHLPYPPPANDMPNAVPEGWSYENIARIAKRASTRFERIAMQQGLGKAIAKYAPKMITTRANLWPGSHYMIDDVWHDHFCYVRTANQSARVLEFGCLDVFSGSRFAWGCRPRLERADGSKTGLKSDEVMLLVAAIMMQTGYSERGTEIMGEHGTAKIPQRVREILYDASGGLINVRESGMTGKEQALSGSWLGTGGGNPRFKSMLESLHNLIHNELAFLAAQTGLSVDRRPEGLSGLLGYTEDICEAMLTLPPERAALLMLPALEYHTEFLPLLGEIYRRIDQRTRHKLEGWVEAGHIVPQYRIAPGQWIDQDQFLTLPLEQIQRINAEIQLDPKHNIAPRRLSPAEAFARGRGQFRTLSPLVISDMLGDRFATEQKIRNGYFEWQDMTLDYSGLRYESRVTTMDGHQEELRDGETYKLIVNPLDLTVAHVHSGNGRYLGFVQRSRAIDRADVESIHKYQGHLNKRIADLLQGVRRRHEDDVKLQIAMREHNARVIAGAAVTPEDKAADKIERQRERKLVATAKTISEEEVASVLSYDTPTTEEFSSEEIAKIFGDLNQ